MTNGGRSLRGRFRPLERPGSGFEPRSSIAIRVKVSHRLAKNPDGPCNSKKIVDLTSACPSNSGQHYCKPSEASKPSEMDPQRTSDAEGLWDAMAAELVELIALYLSPMAAADVWLSQPLALPAAKTHWAESSVGAAHWVQLSQALTKQAPWPTQHVPTNNKPQKHKHELQPIASANISTQGSTTNTNPNSNNNY